MQAPTSYVPRESVPPFGLVLALLVLVPGVSLLAAAYALATFYWPYINVVNLLAAPALGLGVAMISQQAVRAGRIRSRSFGLAITIVGLVLAIHAHWVVWIAALGQDVELLRLAIEPLNLGRAIVWISRAGAREVGDWMPTGAALWLLWAVEAGLILGVGLLGNRTFTRNLYERPFCEECRSWLGPTSAFAWLELGDDDPAQLRAWIAAGDWTKFKERSPSEDEDNAVQLWVGTCNCGELNVLAVERHTTSGGGYDCDVIGKDLLVDAKVIRELGSLSVER